MLTENNLLLHEGVNMILYATFIEYITFDALHNCLQKVIVQHEKINQQFP